MGEPNILDNLKRFIAGVSFKLFLWGNEMTQEVYWDLIYEQEKNRKPQQEKP